MIPAWSGFARSGEQFWSINYDALLQSDPIVTASTLPLISNFMPIYSVKGRQARQRQRTRIDPEYLVSKQMFGWPDDWFDSWKMATFTQDGEVKSMLKYRTIQRFSPKDQQWDWAYSYLDSVYRPFLFGVQDATHEEVITAMDGTKSAGPPFFSCSDTYEFLEEHTDELRKLGSGGFKQLREALVNLWNSKVKEELRPAEKIALNKVRTFTASNKAYYYIFNRVFLRQTQAFNKSFGTTTRHTVGFSAFGRKWHEIMSWLNELPNFFDGDIDRCDGEIQNHEKTDYILWRCSYLDKFTSDEEFRSLCFDILSTELFSYVVDSNGCVWLVPNGTKSGSPDTAMSTTWINQRRKVYAAFKLMGGKTYKEAVALFEEHSRDLQQGDDFVISVSDQMVPRYNFVNIRRVYEENGWHVSTLSTIPRNIEDVTYLGSYTKRHKGYFVPYPCTDKIRCSMGWTRRIIPSMSLARAAVLLTVGYFSEPLKIALKQHIGRLIQRYGKSMRNNKEWQTAMGVLQTDLEIEQFYLDPHICWDVPDPEILDDLRRT